jgi:8-oxo-dGTP pyrophosphatase MutT (NUDIX family)
MLPDCCYRVSIKALITNSNGAILFLNEHGRGLSLPGGGLEHDEKDISESLRREVLEETGQEIVNISNSPIWACVSEAVVYNKRHLSIIYRASLVESSSLKLDDDIIWLNPEKIRVEDFDIAQREIAKDIKEGLLSN